MSRTLADFWSDVRSPFSELRTVGVDQVIELKSTYGLSALRDIQATAGSGSISHTGHEYQLSTTANGPDSATLTSAERGRYVPGYAVEGGIGVRLPAAPTGDQAARWGLFDADNGFLFGQDADGLFVGRRSGGAETLTRRADWNGDELDGTGPSGLTLDPADGHIYQITYTWYGYGVIEYRIVASGPTNRQRPITVHRTRVTGSVSTEQPNLPIRAEVANNGTATALDLFVGGRRQHVLGSYEPNRRITTERRLGMASIGTTFLPVISMRRKSAFLGTSVKLGKVEILTDADLVWQVRTGASLTGASYATPTDHDAAETAVEADTSATALTGGEVIDQGLLHTAQGAANFSDALAPPRFDLIGTEPVTLTARRVSGTNATISAVFGAREEW